MSILNSLRAKQQFTQSAQAGRPAGSHQSLSDIFHIRQLDKMLQQTLEELAQVKARLSQVERELAIRNQSQTIAFGDAGQAGLVASTPPLPIAELKQLAEMAKRFK